MRKLLAIVALLALSTFSFGCTPRMARAALFGAAVAGTVAAVAVSHPHFHHWNCGCPRHTDGGRPVYYYQGGYEYYDSGAGVWYRYE